MTDKPIRAFGPAFVYGASGTTLYTVPTTPITTAFVRDMTFCNSSSAGAAIARLAIGDPTDASKRLINQSIAASTTYSARGLWIMNGGEVLKGQMASIGGPPVGTLVNNTSSGAASTNVSAAWVPAANTQYWNLVSSAKGDAPNTVTMSGNGTWTEVATATTGSVGAINDVRTTLFQWYSTSAGSSATTTATWGANQLEGLQSIFSTTNVPLAAPSPYVATPKIQSATANDSAAPSSTAAGLTPVFGGALTSGITLACQARVDGGASSTPPTGYTEVVDTISINTLQHTAYLITTPPATSLTVPANTWGAANTTLRAAVACEVTPDLATHGLSFTVNVVEVVT